MLPSVRSWGWVWNKASAGVDELQAPALRIWISDPFPSDWALEGATGEGIALVEQNRETRTIVVDVRSTGSVLRVRFRDATGHARELSIVAKMNFAHAFTLVHPQCQRNGIFLRRKEGTPINLFVALFCQRSASGRILVHFIRSADAKFLDAPTDSSPYRSHQMAKRPDLSSGPGTLFSVVTTDRAGRVARFVVGYWPEIPSSRFVGAIGLGVTYYRYQEGSLDGRNLTELALTGKVSISYALVPGRFDLGVNAFGTLAALTHSPDSLSPARFYGLNGRLGYRLPFESKLDLRLLGGWYFWMMSVSAPQQSADDYGLSSAAGPQLYFLVSGGGSMRRAWWAYLKLALISEDSFHVAALSNNEVAVGGGIELTRGAKKPLSLTVDVARTQYESQSNWMRLPSVSIGIQTGL